MKGLKIFLAFATMLVVVSCGPNLPDDPQPLSLFEQLQGAWRINSITTTICFDESVNVSGMSWSFGELDGRCFPPTQEPITASTSIAQIYPESVALHIESAASGERNTKELAILEISGNEGQVEDDRGIQFNIEFSDLEDGKIELISIHRFYIPVFIRDESGNFILDENGRPILDSKESNASRIKTYQLSRIG